VCPDPSPRVDKTGGGVWTSAFSFGTYSFFFLSPTCQLINMSDCCVYRGCERPTVAGCKACVVHDPLSNENLLNEIEEKIEELNNQLFEYYTSPRAYKLSWGPSARKKMVKRGSSRHE